MGPSGSGECVLQAGSRTCIGDEDLDLQPRLLLVVPE